METVADSIKCMLSMDEVVPTYGYKPKEPGHYICCPFHNEKTASLKVYTEAGRGWHCFGCGEGGSVIDFVMKLFNIPFSAAVVRLNADFNLGLSNERPDPREVARHNAERRASEDACRAYEDDYSVREMRFRTMWLRLKGMEPDDPERAGLARTISAAEMWFEEHPYKRELGCPGRNYKDGEYYFDFPPDER